ncbi:hypothetical protein VOLCADRAFT_92299 [Volvox carteri f. nagariensis]|uniref:Uncharacterized protein n=1 Tax=Volvox carteri f. nagariensis TaxID=3068 RepID=D8TZA6_VOLCA|nr:uncharacterized protein VOLCADRAFT_92299 [Volvox carteri f. nagariensis]EFJ47147.1 hypothetical protein VOLCADRAFT_92299 [Volvox carteri f. nagariensis]|eukprot:XP_002951696.1 hypothetical protein VOLCADRAFT_92299 [Volvox carteri f. nagariensis]
MLADDGLLVTLRSGLGVGLDSPDYLSTLRHSFLICQEGSSGLCVIVDPFFREQFKVAGMPQNSAYCAAVANLPVCFVGTIGTVNALVCLLTGTLLQEASVLGIDLPPWRSKQALLSKWLPRRFSDSVFTPPSLGNLHPALRSSVHGDALSTSPTSIQSWPSLTGANSEMASSNGSSSGVCGSDTTTTATCTTAGRTSCRSQFKPHSVVTGFTAPAPTFPANAPCQAAPPAARSASTMSPSCRPMARSALTEQLVSATNLSRDVQAKAAAHWQRYFLNLHDPHQATQQPLSSATVNSPAAEATTTAYAADICGDDSLEASVPIRRKVCNGSAGSGASNLVVSLVHHRAAACVACLKCGGGNGCNLKLSSAACKMLPQVYIVRPMATVEAC